MELLLLCGIQATGKSTFCKQRFSDSHIRLNLDILRTRHREDLIFQACLAAKQPVVIDNTNPTVAERARYILPARTAGFRVGCYYFESRIADALRRNASRDPSLQVPEVGVKSTSAKLQIPTAAEGFDAMHYVRLTDSGFDVQEWKHEV